MKRMTLLILLLLFLFLTISISAQEKTKKTADEILSGNLVSVGWFFTWCK
jgi:hypothetical protein